MVKIAVVQFHIRQTINNEEADVGANLAKAEKFIAEAKESMVDIIIFPEYFLTGPLADKDHLVDWDHKYVQVFCDLARKYSIDIVPGTIVEGDNTEDAVINSAYYIDNKGNILMDYQKVHLWHPERKWLTRGSNGYQTVKNRFGITIGICVCWDIAFPEVFRELALHRGAQLVIAPAYWCYDDAGQIGLGHDSNSEVKLLNAVCALRPFENEVCMAFCNAANDENRDHCPEQEVEHLVGQSQICAPFKGTIVKCDHSREEMIMTDIDVLGITKDAESVYKIRKDWDEGNIHNGPQRR